MSPTPCTFCKIAAAHPPVSTLGYLRKPDQESKQVPSTPSVDEDGHAFLILSTNHVLAFLDIMPLTRGHVLVVPREHRQKLGEVGVRVSRELGQWLPIISRAIMRTIFGESTESDPSTDDSWNWNVVQNNGVGAAQVVPHVHFHIVPRPPLGAAGTAAKMSFIMFGRGQRDDLDDEEAEKLAAELRVEVAKEVVRVRKVEGIDLDGLEEGPSAIGKGRL
ncbi:HIT-like domain-containing protein [Aspergillus lucknowensis]|uniref:HIT-like domain-containing protein n=1 Tax=Aspergillus lucknowensis TaxID=176173 RepID=A0ABR4LLQ3_9EURO